jgi:sn-glycerol 3-phosphate transport system permease protein
MTQAPVSGRPRPLIHLALIVICAILCLPALYALQLATLNLFQALASPPQLFPPGDQLFVNVEKLFGNQAFGQLMANTLIVSLVVVIGKTVCAMLAGLAFVYFRFPGKNILFFFVLLTLLMPTEIILLPLFRLVAELQWGAKNPQLALTIPFLATATGAFLFRQHFSNIPRELAEAAQLDGASPVRFMIEVLVPMSWNVITAHALIQFISSWNSYLWPRLVIPPQNAASQVIQVGVRNALLAGQNSDFALLMAAGLVASLPPVILFVVMQKYFMSGFAITRDK